MTPVAPQTACLFQIKTYLPNNLMQAALSQAESLRDSACDSGTPAELFWGLRASILVVIYGKYMRGVGSASCALWRCFQSLALITLTAKCNAQLFFGVLHSVGIVVLAHVHSFVAQLFYLRYGALVHGHIVVELHVKFEADTQSDVVADEVRLRAQQRLQFLR